MVWTSRYEPVEVGDTTFHELIAATAARQPERVAIDGLGYGELAQRVERVAATLAARGFGPGDVLAIQAPNMAPWAGVALAAMTAGGAVTGISPMATGDEVARQLGDSGASILVTAAHDPSSAVAARESSAVEVIEIGPDLLAADGPARPAPVSPRDRAFLPYSSGTSGLPKGVVLTHANLVTAVRQAQRGLRITPDDVVAVLAPLHHVMGFVITLGCGLAAGARLVMLPRFDPRTFAADVQDATVLIVPPPVLGFLAAQPVELPALQLLVSGGAPLGAPLQRAVAERFPHVVVGQGYGLTETTACASIPDRRLGTVPGSAGRVAPNTELRVGDDGELLIRGPQTMVGYLGNPNATAELIDADGWVHSGDVGRVDAGGNVFVVDRLKELIKVNALQVAPAELEAVLAAHPAVAESAVVGRPDERRGEVPVAFVVARGETDGDALVAWVAERVAPHKRLHDVRFVERLPRTPAGKLLRRVLRDDPAVRRAGDAQRSYV
jgi:acyl-CoA synthetase (AMP-forming)/AMP-acid ligase II